MTDRVVRSSILSESNNDRLRTYPGCVSRAKAKAARLRNRAPQKESLVLLQCLLLALYLILLSVLYLIQLGIGLFCLIFLASLTFFLNVLMEPYNKSKSAYRFRSLKSHTISSLIIVINK